MDWPFKREAGWAALAFPRGRWKEQTLPRNEVRLGTPSTQCWHLLSDRGTPGQGTVARTLPLGSVTLCSVALAAGVLKLLVWAGAIRAWLSLPGAGLSRQRGRAPAGALRRGLSSLLVSQAQAAPTRLGTAPTEGWDCGSYGAGVLAPVTRLSSRCTKCHFHFPAGARGPESGQHGF